jgi:hypothetical protein
LAIISSRFAGSSSEFAAARLFSFLLAFDQLGHFFLIVIRHNFYKSRILECIKFIVLFIVIELVIVRSKIVVVLLVFSVVDPMPMAIIGRDNIVASEIDSVCTRNLKIDTLALGNGEVEGLLVVLPRKSAFARSSPRCVSRHVLC